MEVKSCKNRSLFSEYQVKNRFEDIFLNRLFRAITSIPRDEITIEIMEPKSSLKDSVTEIERKGMRLGSAEELVLYYIYRATTELVEDSAEAIIAHLYNMEVLCCQKEGRDAVFS